MAESMHLIIEGYLFCRKVLNAGKSKRFLDVVDSILPRAETSRLLELGLLELETYSLSGHTTVEVKVRMHDLIRNLGYQMAVTWKCTATTYMPTCMQGLVNVDDEIWRDVKWL
ncbi:hypothetical protein GOP47_0024563 [Adiantum capillus-veneris]|uniref:Uncharacterized protein n=1 Tax=Adiantum capillus-veneris TaxID=13818 RepID=A0A9D4Z2T7_ADICA|nr:hypothetical protein GOP47_0024563 [Adiantum capillus-veneris]